MHLGQARHEPAGWVEGADLDSPSAVAVTLTVTFQQKDWSTNILCRSLVWLLSQGELDGPAAMLCCTARR
jgi:hypothetical protein